MKKSLAATFLSPTGLWIIIVALSAKLQAGHSAAGSPYASEPPQVPRLRIARCAICGAAALSKGACLAIKADSSISVWVTKAPIRKYLPSSLMPLSSSTLVISINILGSERRIFKVANKVWPPAIKRASSPASDSSPSASVKDPGFT